MSVPSVSAHAAPTIVERVDRRKDIEIDLKNFPSYAGYTRDLPGLTDLVLCCHGKNMEMRPVWVDDLIREGCDLKKMPTVGKQPINITFGAAVKLVVEWINESICCDGEIRLEYPPSGSSLFADIIADLSSAETLGPEYIATRVPRHPDRICSASPDHVNFVLGAIIHMLFDAKAITTYGAQGGRYWVKVPQ